MTGVWCDWSWGQSELWKYSSSYFLLQSLYRNPTVILHSGEGVPIGHILAGEKFQPYVEGRHFTVETDHRTLCRLYSMRGPNVNLQRRSRRLQTFDFEIQHIPGRCNQTVDVLSRLLVAPRGRQRYIWDRP
jgi:hypothetical protein